MSPVSFDPRRALATCLKPADDPAASGVVVRLWETAGQSGPLILDVGHVRRAVRTDLLERDLGPLPIVDGQVHVDLPAFGFAAVRLVVGAEAR
jgi:hypothetical protein